MRAGGLESPDPSLPRAGALANDAVITCNGLDPFRRTGTVVAKWSVLAPVGPATRAPYVAGTSRMQLSDTVVLVAEAGYGCWVVWSGAARYPDPREGEHASRQDDDCARQLEAMRQYVAELGVQRDGPTAGASAPQPASERRRRPSPPWLLLTGLLVAVALVGGGLVGAVA
jgi:hypothetical protein